MKDPRESLERYDRRMAAAQGKIPRVLLLSAIFIAAAGACVVIVLGVGAIAFAAGWL